MKKDVKLQIGPGHFTAADSRRYNASALTVVVGVLWLSAVVAATVLIINYSNSPGVAGTAPPTWPVQSRIPLDARRPTLVMFAHPRCPCTRASLGELELLLARSQGQVSTYVMFLRPAGTDEEWVKTDLWRKASEIPGVTVRCDDAGVEARRFQSETSGDVLLYDCNGRIMFHGGITISRGHSGDNPGRSALAALLRHEPVQRLKTPVFGCSLSETQCRNGDAICTNN